MAAPWNVLVEVDVEEPRTELGLLNATSDGTLWDSTVGNGSVWVDWVTKTAMLAPLPVTPEWRTTFSGSYARLQKSDYTLTDTTKWTEVPRTATGDHYLVGSDGTFVNTTATYDINQGMYISFLVPGTETIAEQTVLTCGWGEQDAAGSVWLRIRANGQISVYKGDDIVGTYDLEGGLPDAGTTKRTPGALNGKTVDMLLIPCRRRALLVVTTAGTGFEHTFVDLDAGLNTNTITPAESFFWNVPVGQACVQLAPLKYKTSGTFYSQSQKLKYPPQVGQAFSYLTASDEFGTNLTSSLAVASVVKSDTTSYTPDGTIDTVRIKVVMAGDGTGSVGVYGVDAYSPCTRTTTADAAVDVTCNLRSLRFSVPENGVVTGKLEMLNPEALAGLGMEQPDITGDRPFRVAVADIDIIRGTMKHPRREYAQGANAEDVDLLVWDLVDRWQDMIDEQMQAVFPFDGLPITYDGVMVGAVEYLLKFYMPYDATELMMSEDAFILPYTPGVSAGEWSLLPGRGDTVAQWLEKLINDYAATWSYGWGPYADGYKFRFADPDDLPSTPGASLYQSGADALADGVAAGMVQYRTIKNFAVDRIRPEANKITVVGNDLRTGREIIATWDDAASQDPTTAPGSRPENWAGKVLPVFYMDPAITTQAAADRARDVLSERLGVVQIIATWESELLVSDDDVPMWVGDVVEIFDEGGATSDLWRIREFTAEFDALVNEEEGLWTCQYTAEKVPA